MPRSMSIGQTNYKAEPVHDPLTSTLSTLLGIAWLLPLASFMLILFFGKRMGKAGIFGGYLACAAILCSCVLALVALFGVWLPNHPLSASAHQVEHVSTPSGANDSVIVRGQSSHESSEASAQEESHAAPPVHFGDWYTIAQFGSLKVTIGYYIDSLTVLMFAMVTFIATCIHFYALGYMHDELHEVVDHEVTLSDGHHLHRPGRFYRFFQYMSLFSFSMLGIVIAGNIAMVFVFWELVGICSYFLIGFYIERKSASNAANKAFIVNRIGDFGMIVGLMAFFGSLGTFQFGGDEGLFNQVRSKTNGYQLVAPDGMFEAVAAPKVAEVAVDHAVLGASRADAESEIAARLPAWRAEDQAAGGQITRQAYWLLVIAGLGIFCGCVGKSAQFPLHVWLPDAMEGPTPVSALVHSATMVAAGVYLVGRFYPMFAPEVLLVIAIIGCITLLLAATIAITATDIKRVLAYSTVSQLGYMMLALGVGGWLAGMLHLITHAFFKSLLFLCSGSVIHAVHTNDMTEMGGLRKKMPWTAYTMLVGCLAIAGAGIPLTSIGLSGYYSKDAIIAQVMSFTSRSSNPLYVWLLYAAAGGASITAFYMFRLWYMTFAGKPRDHHKFDHAHESPRVMVVPLVILAVLAVAVAWPVFGLERLLEQGRPPSAPITTGFLLEGLRYTSEHDSHLFHTQAGLIAAATALAGFLLATLFYGARILDADEARKQFAPIHRFLVHKWYFDEVYQALFVKPVLFIARRVAEFDKKVIDWLIDHSAICVQRISDIDDLIDRYLVDGLVNWTARRTYAIGLWLRGAQTGQVRQYVMFIVVGTVGLFILATVVWDYYIGHA